MTEDRLALRLKNIRDQADRAIRNGQQLDPHLIRSMTLGEHA